jgi:hypothetical protein
VISESKIGKDVKGTILELNGRTEESHEEHQ